MARRVPLRGHSRTPGALVASLITSLWLLTAPALGQAPAPQSDGLDHGQTGTLNHDYFAALDSPGTHLHWLIGDIEQAHLTPALDDIRHGRYSKATADLHYLLMRFVNHPDALQAMEAVEILTKRRGIVKPYFEHAVRLYPQYPITLAQYGRYLARIGEGEAAVTMLKRAIELDPGLAVAHAWLSEVYAKTGQAQLGREAAERARQLGYQGKL
jgi:predicted Zn-dependent protease